MGPSPSSVKTPSMDKYVGLPQERLRRYHFYMWNNFVYWHPPRKHPRPRLDKPTCRFYVFQTDYRQDVTIERTGLYRCIVFSELDSHLSFRMYVKVLTLDTILFLQVIYTVNHSPMACHGFQEMIIPILVTPQGMCPAKTLKEGMNHTCNTFTF